MLDRDALLALEWRFTANAYVATKVMRLLATGRIAGYRHANEFYWALEGEHLVLMNENRDVTSRLSLVSGPSEPPRLAGPYTWDATIGFELTGAAPQPWPDVDGATRLRLASQIEQFGWSVGAQSYGAPTVYEGGYANLTIGRFCSIAEGVTIVLGDHKVANVTSYPFMTLSSAWPSRPIDAVDHVSRGDVVIGNDVWLGAGTFIGSGVTIGDGAVIGARSVVTRDVPPYAIALGAPARVVRSRFSPAQVEALVAIRWWDWPELWIDAVIPLLISERIDAFIQVGLAKPESLEALVALVDEALKAPPVKPSLVARLKARVLRLLGR